MTLEDWKKAVGKRILIKEWYSKYSPIKGVKLLEVAPNKPFGKIKNLLTKEVEWIDLNQYTLLDFLPDNIEEILKLFEPLKEIATKHEI